MLKYMPIEVIITSTTAVNTPNSLEIIENTGASPLPSNNTPKREAMEIEKKNILRAVSLFQIGYIVGICQGLIHSFRDVL